MSTKRSQDQMMDEESFLPSFNSTFVDLEGKGFAKIIHDLVFQRFGDQRRIYRSKRLKVLRRIFYPDITDESSCKSDKIKCSLLNFEDMMENNEDHYHNEKENIGKVDDAPGVNGLARSSTFRVAKNEDERLEDNGNNKDGYVEVSKRPMNLTYTQSVGSEDISALLSNRSIHFSNTKSASKSFNDDNNNTVIEESNGVDLNAKDDLQHCIDAQETAIQEFEKVLVFGRRRRGFAGSIPHIQAEKGLLVANLRKQVLTASLNNEFHCPSTQNSLKGKVTINNIKCDTDIIIGDDHGIPPCYYLCIVQHETTVLCTDMVAPDTHGVIEFPSKFVFENITNDFTIKLLLFKLKLNPDSETISWRMSLRKRQIELPRLDLVGAQDIAISNINKTDFPFDIEILYANIIACVNMSNRKEGPLTIERIVRKTNKETKLVSHKRWCILEGTDLKVYRCCRDVEYSEPIEVISLAYCKSCKPYDFTPKTLMLDFVHAYFGRTLYLPFDDNDTFRDWLNEINIAIATAKAFGL